MYQVRHPADSPDVGLADLRQSEADCGRALSCGGELVAGRYGAATGAIPAGYQLPTTGQGAAAVRFALAQAGKPYIGGVGGVAYLVHAPQSGQDVQVDPLSSWKNVIVAIRRPLTLKGL